MAERLVVFINSNHPTVLNDFYNHFVIYLGHDNVKFSEIDPNVVTFDAIMRDIRYFIRTPPVVHIIRIDDQFVGNNLYIRVKETLKRYYHTKTYHFNYSYFNGMDINHPGPLKNDYDYQMYHTGNQVELLLDIEFDDPYNDPY